jgi:ABC-type glycerol-3-phosphate transport system substrate-binding protein
MKKRILFTIFGILIVLSILLSSCQPTTTQPPAEEPTTEEPVAEGKPFEGVTINIMMEGVPDTEFVQELLPQFEEQTGMKVNIEVLNYALMHEKLIPQLTAPEGGGSYDVIVVDNYWVGEFISADWLMDLDDRLANSKTISMDDYLPSMVNMVGVLGDKAYMVPFYNYAMALIYCNVPEVEGKVGEIPNSIPEYVELIKSLTDADAGFYGASMMGLRPDPITMEWLNYLYSSGGLIYDEDWNVTVNNENGVEALTQYVDAMKNAASSGAPAYGFDETFSEVAQGKAFSFITFNWMLPQLNDPEMSQVVDMCTVTSVPGGKGLLGGWGWAIPKSSPSPDAAWAFIEWAESFDVAKARALAGGAPARIDVFEDSDVLAAYPYYTEVKQIVGEAITFPIMSRSPQVVEVLGRVLSEAVIGSKSPQEALDEAAAELAGLVD